MRDGLIQDGKAWFSFDVAELWWLYHLIPESDGFRREVWEAIRTLECEAPEIEVLK